MALPTLSLTITPPGGKTTLSSPSDTSTSSPSSTSAPDTTSPTNTSTSSTDTSTSSTPTSDTSTSDTSTSTTSSGSDTTSSSFSSSSSDTSSSSSLSSGSSSSTTTGKSSSTTNGGSTTTLGTPSASVITTHSTIVTSSNGVAVTYTSEVTIAVGGGTATVPNALPNNTSAVATHTPTPFLKNTAAVAGTFSAVGVIALIVLFWAGTAFMRRRRERRFDDEADAAAAEAYKSAAGQAPYLDDDEDFPGAGRSAYSRETAGSMGQPPLAPSSGESYGMRELSPNPGYAPDVAGGAYGAAGLGAGLGANAALQRQRSQKSAGSGAPYNAYAGPAGGADWQYGGQQDPYAAAYPIPNAQPYQPYGAPQQAYVDAASHQDLLASAGIEPAEQASHRLSSAAVAAQQRGVALARSPSQAVTVHAGPDGLHRNKSITLEQGWTETSTSVQVQHAQSAQVQYMSAQNPYADVYDGVHQEQHRAYFEPDADSVIPGINYLDDDGASVRSADHPRVLRVANE